MTGSPEGGEEGPRLVEGQVRRPWQIVPTAIQELFSGADAAATERVMAALLQMSRIDIAALQKAYDDAG